jgi:hypothetical protein
MLKQLDVLIGFITVMSLVSLLITVITQLVSSKLDLRGKNLLSALEAMFLTLKPDLKDGDKNKAFALADAILRHPAISDSIQSDGSRTLASAIRPQELLDIIEKIATDSTKQVALIGKVGELKKVSAFWKTNENISDKTVTSGDLESAAKEILEVLRKPSQSVMDSASKLKVAVSGLDDQTKQKALEAVKQLEDSARTSTVEAIDRTEKWLNTVEDRSRAWFSTHAQIVSGIAAVIIAFGLQLDTLDLYQKLGSDDKLRAELVASSGSLKLELEKLKEKTATETNQLEAVKLQINRIDKNIDKTGFQIAPQDYCETWKQYWNQGDFHRDRFDFHGGFIRHLIGIIFSAALLSLGSPFWFNLLKDFTGLRSSLAKQVDKDKDSKQD